MSAEEVAMESTVSTKNLILSTVVQSQVNTSNTS